MRNISCSILAAGLVLGGCHHDKKPVVSAPPPPERLLPVSAVISAVKCELAETFVGGRFSDVVKFDNDDGKDITAKLSLGRVYSAKDAGSGGVTIPLGIEIGGSMDGSLTRTDGETYDLSFDYDLTEFDAPPAFCAELSQEVRVQGDPFVEMIEAVQAEFEMLGEGDPKVRFASISHTSNFTVKKEQTAGGTVSFLIFKVGSSRTLSTSTSQSLTLTFTLGGDRVKDWVVPM